MMIARGLKRYFPIRGGVLNRRVAEVKAVDDISFTVLKGETLGVVGESGCGKSTLARLLMHLLPCDSGEIIFDGDAVGQVNGLPLRDLRRNLQMVFQDSYSSLNPRLPIEESVAYAPRVDDDVQALVDGRPEPRYADLGRSFGAYDLSQHDLDAQLVDRAQRRTGDAQSHPATFAFEPEPAILQVGQEATLGLVVRVRNIVADHRLLAGDITDARHVLPPAGQRCKAHYCIGVVAALQTSGLALERVLPTARRSASGAFRSGRAAQTTC